jgi:hypothetical protein
MIGKRFSRADDRFNKINIPAAVSTAMSTALVVSTTDFVIELYGSLHETTILARGFLVRCTNYVDFFFRGRTGNISFACSALAGKEA